MTQAEEAHVLKAGLTYFDFGVELRDRVESGFAHEQPAADGGTGEAPRRSTPLTASETEFAAFLAVGKIMAGFRREIDAI